jgi:hypothetical protein
MVWVAPHRWITKDKLWKGGGGERLSDFSLRRKQWIVGLPAPSQAGGKVKPERLSTQGVRVSETRDY